MTKKILKVDAKKIKKQEIIYSAIVEKELLHNWLVQKEQLKTLKELNVAIKELIDILKVFETHEFLTIHKSKWKIALYNLSLWMLFAIWTVLWLLFLSWSTFHFFKDSEALKNIVNNQLSSRQFNVQEIKEKADEAIKISTDQVIKTTDDIINKTKDFKTVITNSGTGNEIQTWTKID